ncbi:MAG TPA: L,D-transpeptidase family protein [Legionellaceae bacterium]|nr:L,D-transpeptidase family protein [Legionellaceae bacterium]
MMIDLCHTLNRIPIETSVTQMILVEPRTNFHALVHLCEKKHHEWKTHSSYEPFPAVIGEHGIAAVGEKKEGDLKTPAGLYAIGDAFGSKPLALKMDYKYITTTDKYIDDPNHPHYNQWISGETSASSYERMLNPLYQYGAVIQYNQMPVIPGLGSAIFLHIWRSQDAGTAGCVALQEKNVLKILHWLDKNKHPHIKILS